MGTFGLLQQKLGSRHLSARRQMSWHQGHSDDHEGENNLSPMSIVVTEGVNTPGPGTLPNRLRQRLPYKPRAGRAGVRFFASDSVQASIPGPPN